MSTQLKVRLEKYFDGFDLVQETGVKTNIYPVGPKNNVDSHASKGIYDTTIPVGTGETYKEIDINPGHYMIECILPSGSILREDVNIMEGEVTSIAISDDQFSPHEHLAWQQFTGNLERQEVYNKSLEKKVPKRRALLSPQVIRTLYLTNKYIKRSIKSLTSTYGIIGQFLELELWPDKLDLRKLLAKLDYLVYTGIFDFSRSPFEEKYLSGGQQWEHISRMTRWEGKNRYKELMERSLQSVENPASSTYPLWIPPPREDEEVHYYRVDSLDLHPIRHFAIWTTSGCELLLAPDRWMDFLRYEPANIEIMVDITYSDMEFKTNTSVNNTYMASALAYMTNGALPSAKLYLENASEMLFHKMTNPYAAAAGAYILLETLDWQSISNTDSDYHARWSDWKKWIFNLYDRFKWLPDGAVLHGWSLIKQEKQNEAKDVFLEAFDRGIPIYSSILKKLLEGLRIFSAEQETLSYQEDENIKKKIDTIRQICWRTNMQQLFTTIRLGPNPKFK